MVDVVQGVQNFARAVSGSALATAQHEFETLVRPAVEGALPTRYTKGETARILQAVVAGLILAPLALDPLATPDRKVAGAAAQLLGGYLALLSNSGLSGVPAYRSAYDILQLLVTFQGPASAVSLAAYTFLR